MNTASLMLDLARSMPKPLTMRKLIEGGSKPESDPMARLHNHAVKEAAYELLDSGKIKMVGENIEVV